MRQIGKREIFGRKRGWKRVSTVAVISLFDKFLSFITGKNRAESEKKGEQILSDLDPVALDSLEREIRMQNGESAKLDLIDLRWQVFCSEKGYIPEKEPKNWKTYFLRKYIQETLDFSSCLTAEELKRSLELISKKFI